MTEPDVASSDASNIQTKLTKVVQRDSNNNITSTKYILIKERPNWLPMETCAIYWNDRQGRPIRICSNLTNTLQTHIGKARLREYWIGKAKYSPMTERTIDWDSHHKSHKNMASDRHRWLSKWLTGFCGIRITLQLYRHQTHMKCPCCNINETTVAHVLHCQASAA